MPYGARTAGEDLVCSGDTRLMLPPVCSRRGREAQSGWVLVLAMCLAGASWGSVLWREASPEELKLSARQEDSLFVLDASDFRHHVEFFNGMEPENIVNHVPNRESWVWMRENIPFFECPDKSFEQIYYFRWWTFRKHLKKTPEGFVFTEFLDKVGHSGKYNTISCALGHHICEAPGCGTNGMSTITPASGTRATRALCNRIFTSIAIGRHGRSIADAW